MIYVISKMNSSEALTASYFDNNFLLKHFINSVNNSDFINLIEGWLL